MKRLIYVLIGVLGTLTLLLIIWQLRSIVLLFLGSLAIAAAMNTPIQYLVQLRLSRSVALLVAYFLVVGGLLFLVTAISGPLVDELDRLTQDVIRVYEQRSTGWGESLLSWLPTSDVVASLLTGTPEASPFFGVVDLTQNALNFLSQLLLAIVISIYWTADSQRFERLWLSLLHPEQRTPARRNWHTLEAKVGAYIRSELVQSLLAGALVTFGLWLVGANYLFLPAFVVALTWLVPLVGGLLALIGVALFGWLSGPFIVLFSIIYTIIILSLMEFGVERYLYGEDGYSSILVLLAMIAMADAFGLLGLLVAPPIALVIQVFWLEFVEASSSVPATATTPDINRIHKRVAELHVQIGQKELSPRVTNLLERLDLLMQEVDQALPLTPNPSFDNTPLSPAYKEAG
jgi:putative permease